MEGREGSVRRGCEGGSTGFIPECWESAPQQAWKEQTLPGEHGTPLSLLITPPCSEMLHADRPSLICYSLGKTILVQVCLQRQGVSRAHPGAAVTPPAVSAAVFSCPMPP